MKNSKRKIKTIFETLIINFNLMVFIASASAMGLPQEYLYYIHRGDKIKLESVLSKNPEIINLRDQYSGLTLLHHAVIAKKIDIVKCLYKAGADIRCVSHNGDSLMHFAASNGNLELLNYLKNNGLNPNSPNSQQQTPLHCALLGKQPDIIDQLLAWDVDTLTTTYLKETALHYLNMGEHPTQFLPFLVNFTKDADMNARDIKGSTPLHTSITNMGRANVQNNNEGSKADFERIRRSIITREAKCNNRTAIIQKLVDFGSNVDTEDYFGMTPLFLAYLMFEPTSITKTQTDKTSEYSLTIDFTGDRNDLHPAILFFENWHVKQQVTTNYSLLHIATAYGLDLSLEALYKPGDEFKKEEGNSNTFLHIATQYDQVAAIVFWLKKGTNINATNHEGQTPLHMVTRNQSYNALQALLQKKNIDINATDNEGRTLVHIVAELGLTAPIKCLIPYKPNLDIGNNQSKKAWEIAQSGGYEELAQLLISSSNHVKRRTPAPEKQLSKTKKKRKKKVKRTKIKGPVVLKDSSGVEACEVRDEAHEVSTIMDNIAKTKILAETPRGELPAEGLCIIEPLAIADSISQSEISSTLLYEEKPNSLSLFSQRELDKAENKIAGLSLDSIVEAGELATEEPDPMQFSAKVDPVSQSETPSTLPNKENPTSLSLFSQKELDKAENQMAALSLTPIVEAQDTSKSPSPPAPTYSCDVENANCENSSPLPARAAAEVTEYNETVLQPLVSEGREKTELRKEKQELAIKSLISNPIDSSSRTVSKDYATKITRQTQPVQPSEQPLTHQNETLLQDKKGASAILQLINKARNCHENGQNSKSLGLLLRAYTQLLNAPPLSRETRKKIQAVVSYVFEAFRLEACEQANKGEYENAQAYLRLLKLIPLQLITSKQQHAILDSSIRLSAKMTVEPKISSLQKQQEEGIDPKTAINEALALYRQYRLVMPNSSLNNLAKIWCFSLDLTLNETKDKKATESFRLLKNSILPWIDLLGTKRTDVIQVREQCIKLLTISLQNMLTDFKANRSQPDYIEGLHIDWAICMLEQEQLLSQAKSRILKEQLHKLLSKKINNSQTITINGNTATIKKHQAKVMIKLHNGEFEAAIKSCTEIHQKTKGQLPESIRHHIFEGLEQAMCVLLYELIADINQSENGQEYKEHYLRLKKSLGDLKLKLPAQHQHAMLWLDFKLIEQAESANPLWLTQIKHTLQKEKPETVVAILDENMQTSPLNLSELNSSFSSLLDETWGMLVTKAKSVIINNESNEFEEVIEALRKLNLYIKKSDGEKIIAYWHKKRQQIIISHNDLLKANEALMQQQEDLLINLIKEHKDIEEHRVLWNEKSEQLFNLLMNKIKKHLENLQYHEAMEIVQKIISASIFSKEQLQSVNEQQSYASKCEKLHTWCNTFSNGFNFQKQLSSLPELPQSSLPYPLERILYNALNLLFEKATHTLSTNIRYISQKKDIDDILDHIRLIFKYLSSFTGDSSELQPFISKIEQQLKLSKLLASAPELTDTLDQWIDWHSSLSRYPEELINSSLKQIDDITNKAIEKRRSGLVFETSGSNWLNAIATLKKFTSLTTIQGKKLEKTIILSNELQQISLTNITVSGGSHISPKQAINFVQKIHLGQHPEKIILFLAEIFSTHGCRGASLRIYDKVSSATKDKKIKELCNERKKTLAKTVSF